MSARRDKTTPRSRRRETAWRALALAASVFALLAGVALWSLAPQSAEAHALLVRSDPPVNARLLDPPKGVTAFFSEALDSRLSSMQVLDGSGARVDTGETSFGPEATQMAIGVKELAPGFYTVIWETLSSIDGHLLKGSFPFTVLNADGSEPSGPRFAGPATDGYSGGSPKWENVVTKWLGLLAAVAVLGSLAFVLWVVRPATAALDEPWRQRVREAARRHLAWLIWPGLAALALAGLAEVLLQARQLGGVGFLDDVLRNSWGERWIQRQLVLGAMLAAALVSGQLWRRGRGSLSEAALWVVLAGAFGYVLLVAMTSHGGSIPGSFWAVGADFVHLAASAVWIGMLAQLLLLLWWCRRYASDAERAEGVSAHLQRFSTFAATSVALLIASGAVNGLSQIPVPEAMLDTAYGRALTVKLCLMMALLAVAGANAVYLRPRLTSGPTPSGRLRPLLARTTAVEIGMAVIVLLV
ncbi:MAG TPA: CopD family protein, partial [Dehalococcoidia bacterium]|nr:CopD family protein [Dehalococcoidia bacterium]